LLRPKVLRKKESRIIKNTVPINNICGGQDEDSKLRYKVRPTGTGFFEIIGYASLSYENSTKLHDYVHDFRLIIVFINNNEIMHHELFC